MAPTIDELLLSIDVEEQQAEKSIQRSRAEAKAILAKAKNEGRPNLTVDEDEDVENALKAEARGKIDLEGIRHKKARALSIKKSEDENDLDLLDRRSDPVTAGSRKPAYDQVARVGQEERTYHRGNTRGGGLFLRDVVKQFLYRDMESEMRLSRHMQEERVERGQYLERAAGTGAFAGLTVPQYLTEMYAPAVAVMRPFADICTKHELPESGMTVNISRITTATSVGLQATENTAVSETNIDDTLLTENVQTAAGQQTLSRQAIERGTGVEDITMGDLYRRYATTLDNTLINQAVTGLMAVSSVQTYTTGAPTTPLLYGQMVQGASSIEGVLLGFGVPDFVVMHSRRWYSMLDAVGPNWPMIDGAGADTMALGTSNNTRYGAGVRGTLKNGLGVCVDNNIATNTGAGTNQDTVFVVPHDECHLWEDPNAPVFLRAEQAAVANLGVLLVLYGYFAYTFRRFTNATVGIAGTGLTPPLFNGA